MRKLILSLLMLSVFLFAIGSVKAQMGCVEGHNCDSGCKVIIDEPQEGGWYDPVTIGWHYEEAVVNVSCNNLLEVYLAYQKGSCGWPYNWKKIADDITPSETEYEWDVSSLLSGQYCVAVNIDQISGPDVGDTSGLFNLDLDDPVLTKTVGEPNVECEDESCDFYVTQDTEITLSCEDEDSGVDYIEYRINDGDWQSYEGPFTFEEDSEHVLEARCFDNVGKSDYDREIFFVDSKAPTITKYVSDPKVGDCPPEEEGDECYVAAEETEITFEAIDEGDHQVGLDKCYYWYYVGEERFPKSGSYSTQPIIFHEQSMHDLTIRCKDFLGNSLDDIETFFVDATAPETTLNYDGPQYGGFPKWIDGVTKVVLTADDEGDHQVGSEETFYRFGLVDDEFCSGEPEEDYEISGVWNTYEGPFSIPQESCHAIEYYSVDKLGNEEDVNYNFVFVDKTKPLTDKDVGKPSHECTLGDDKCEESSYWEERSWDWIVTMNTPVELSCADSGDHPSGVGDAEYSGIWYRIILDGDEENPLTNCENPVDGWCFVPENHATVYFTEESEHLLEFYCVDNVNKISTTDSEIFKVEGEEFRIPLYKKWNLISIPFTLIDENVEDVFEQISDKVEVVWSYDPERCEDESGWCVYTPNGGPDNLEKIEPGYGYWVKAKEDTELLVGGSLLRPAPGVPPSRNLEQGWNLIGHYGTAPGTVYCSLFSLVDTTIGHPRWSALYGYDAVSDVFESLNLEDSSNAGEGYWIEMDVEDTYSPATTCWGFPYLD